MFEREKHEANREALAGSKVHHRPSAQRYEAAFRRYLAAIAYHDERSAHAGERPAATPADADRAGASPGDEVRWDLDTEAAEMLRYQQAYNASARIIQVARESIQALFDALN